MIDHDDDELRATFLQLRDEDAIQAPPFRAPKEHLDLRAIPARHSSRRTIQLLAAALLLAIGLGVMRDITRRSRAKQLVARNATQSISSWRSPTAGLLRTSGRELLAPSPVLSSVINTPMLRVPGKVD